MNPDAGTGPDHVGRGDQGDDREVDATEILALDERFGLAAFGTERPDEPSGSQTPGPPETEMPPAMPVVLSRDASPIGPPAAAFETGVAQATGSLTTERGETAVATQVVAPTRSALAAILPSESATARISVRRWIVPAAVLVILAIISVSIWAQRRPSARTASAGTLTIDTTPPGARVIIGGRDRGRTPLSLTLAPGTYDVDLRAGEERHVLPVRVSEGAPTSQHVFLRQARTSSGKLRVTSDPPAAAVAVDGRGRGTTPVLITDLAAGPHDITVRGTSGEVRQRVQVDADATTTVLVPLPKAALPQQGAGGWLSIATPTELQVFEDGRLLGTTRIDRLMLTAGSHTLRLSNDAAGVEVTRQVAIARGQTTRLQITLPPGTLSINAVPWATVAIDGREVGETPLGNVELSPGPHEILFRHPELGERRQQVTVRSEGASRLSVDLRK